MTKNTTAIVVTHNSEGELEECLRGLAAQNVLPGLVIVDSGSDNTDYLAEVNDMFPGVRVLQGENVGFSRGNNRGYGTLTEETSYVVFLNPDTILSPDFIARAQEALEQNPETGIVTGRMLGYDFTTGRPTGLIDSTGIFRKWYGRWYDRGQGEKNGQQYMQEEEVPAACGALLFCRRKALEQGVLPDGSVFDPDFFLYKEDIELSLRVKKAGWGLRYVPSLVAWHGRGWNRQRKEMPRKLRLVAAKNELLLCRKHPSPAIVWALAKYLLVRVFNQ